MPQDAASSQLPPAAPAAPPAAPPAPAPAAQTAPPTPPPAAPPPPSAEPASDLLTGLPEPFTTTKAAPPPPPVLEPLTAAGVQKVVRDTLLELLGEQQPPPAPPPAAAPAEGVEKQVADLDQRLRNFQRGTDHAAISAFVKQEVAGLDLGDAAKKAIEEAVVGGQTALYDHGGTVSAGTIRAAINPYITVGRATVEHAVSRHAKAREAGLAGSLPPASGGAEPDVKGAWDTAMEQARQQGFNGTAQVRRASAILEQATG